MTEILFENARWQAATPQLSILIPFKGDDPVRLLAALSAQTSKAEIVLLDDGSNDPGLSTRVQAQIADHPLPARLVQLQTNVGRAKGRNLLTRHARADTFLFLDSDMLPDSEGFVQAWLDLVTHQNPPVAFGGFSLAQVHPRPDQALHQTMAGQSDCLSAEERQTAPEKNLFTSNLLVRRDVFAAEAFDEAFTGWGWEDVEWGMRVARRWQILHVDNPATHLGLDTAATIAAKYEQSAANFARVVTAHRQVVCAYPSYRVARILKWTPWRSLWRPLLKAYALIEGAPLQSRALAMRLYRAALYAEAV